jgi:histidinol-phosphate aminotransferase
MIKSNELINQITRPPADQSCRKDHYRFDRNERTTLFDDHEFNQIISQISPYDLVAYGELEPFYEKIKDWLNISRNQVLLTSGSDMAIRSIFQTFIEKGDKVLITQPNYAMFSFK